MERSEASIVVPPRADLFIATMKDCQTTGMQLASELRDEGIRVEIDLMERNFKNAAKFVNAMNIPFMIFVGKKEIESGSYTIKNFATQEQFENQSVADIVALINKDKNSKA